MQPCSRRVGARTLFDGGGDFLLQASFGMEAGEDEELALVGVINLV
jgi:hypothetical protein